MRSYLLRTPTFAARLFPHATWSLGSQYNKINLSIDDGPDPSSTPYILDQLALHDIKVTFFILGKQVEKYPSLYQEIKAQGHQIGSHGYDHLNGWKTPTKEYVLNALKGAEVVSSKLFRPPYGKLSPKQYQLLYPQLKIVMWSLMSGDFDPKVDIKTHNQRIHRHTSAGDIIVMHDQARSVSLIKEALPVLIELTDANNWKTSLI